MSSRLLASLKLSQLKHAAFLTGLPSTGTKADIIAVLSSHASSGVSTSTGGGRIVSVDMGIRNLAYCVLDVPALHPFHADGNKRTPLKVLDWRKIDLIHHTGKSQEPESSSGGGGEDNQTKPATTPRTKKRVPPIPASIFAPSQLSKTAYTIAKDLLRHNPTTILIERQRFRSGGGAAIQEWTVRVNMLESMLWACLRTLRENSPTARQFPAVHEVNPARVANFWVSDPAGSTLHLTAETFAAGSESQAKPAPNKSLSARKRIQKKDKIGVVRSWLHSHGSNNNDSNKNPGISLAFEGEAAEVAKAFSASSTRSPPGGSGKGGMAAAAAAAGDVAERARKLDDLADCLLQAAAWVRWGQNRGGLADLVVSGKGG
ncbi:hypothetical protein B0A55_00539 [Friedmanniomyces simplex]|uniref:SAP domain-containing protein n=1 Tax=Friedmanniomyces simplex TaxID=329884 RepID=A0A4U0Y017_9PEZI|nr:hypothetical protein B0A55_00539 [Friedmanniomyces simplex]